MEFLALSTFLLFADFGQTRYISKSENYYEKNQVIGKNPNLSRVNAYFLSAIAINASAGLFLKPLHAKKVWLAVSLVQINVVAQNARIGIGFNFEI